jgi:heme/copper-type cytochrome/quinol oxidase subunit 3
MNERAITESLPPRRPHVVLNLGQLPDVVFGPRDLMWWGTLGFMMIEGFTLVLCAGVWVYLQQNTEAWPPRGTPLPALGVPTACLVLMLVSLPFVAWLDRSAHRYELRKVQVGLTVASLWLAVVVGLRIVTLVASLNVNWDTNAYGSAQWLVVAAHGSLQLVELVEIGGMALLFWIAPVERKHFSDAADVVFYWYFVTLSWVPLYILCFLVPRWI